MSAFADSIAAVIAKLGEAVTLSYETGATFNADTGEKTPGSAVNVSAFGAPSNYNAGEINGTTVRDGDIKLTLEQIDTAPAVGWTCTLNSIVYRIESIKTVRKSAESVVYILQLRLA